MPGVCGCAPRSIRNCRRPGLDALRAGLAALSGRARLDRPDRHHRSGQGQLARPAAELVPRRSIIRTGGSAWLPRAIGNCARIGFTDGDRAAAHRLARSAQGGRCDRGLAPAATATSCAPSPKFPAAFWPRTPTRGRVLAMQGGFDPRLGSFNRATQALAPAGFDDQALRLCHRARSGHDPGLDGARRPILLLSGRRAGREMLPQFRRQRQRRPSIRCAGASSSRAI